MINHVVEYTFSVKELKENNLPPLIDSLIKEFNLSSTDQVNLRTILIELITNSLEHGLLQLDSSSKKDSKGFDDYYKNRQKRLQELVIGKINISIISLVSDVSDPDHLVVTVEDSGSGFVHSKHTGKKNNTHLLSGRGIMLVKSLCESIDYTNNGRTVNIKYRLESFNDSQLHPDSLPPVEKVNQQNSLGNILLVEDEEATLKFMSQFLRKLGYEVATAENVDAGIEYFENNKPDIVITDYNMPGRLGIDLIVHIRKQVSDYWPPIIVLSAMHEQEKVLSCLEAGADDYLTKPVNLKILNAKITTHSRLVNLQKENIKTKAELQKAYNEMAQEEILAESLLDRILKRNPTDKLPLHFWLEPASRFSGDLVTIAKSKDDETFIILADVTGHGLAASLSTLIITQIFHDMVERNCLLGDIISKINSATYDLLPVNFFAAASIIKLSVNNDSIEIWMGGLPDLLITDSSGKLVEKISSQHMALGILPPSQFHSTTLELTWQQDVYLTLYTDGVIECRNIENEKFGETKLLEAISLESADANDIVNNVKDKLKLHVGSLAIEDDVTTMVIAMMKSS